MPTKTRSRCPRGNRRCSYTKKCVRKEISNKKRCPKGSRRCANNTCHLKKIKTPSPRRTRSRGMR